MDFHDEEPDEWDPSSAASWPGHWSGQRGSGNQGPAAQWREHWFDHQQVVQLACYDDQVAIYLDGDVDRAHSRWLLAYLSDAWLYSKDVYGHGFGPDPRLYSIHHGHRHAGGHPGYHYDPTHDHRNVIDCGLSPWSRSNEMSIDMLSHEIAHVVESANNSAHRSPAFPIWRDSKWAEFFQYDLYVGLDLGRDARRLHDRFTRQTEDFPRPGTHWFRDWFHPLWDARQGPGLMVDFFRLLARHFPTDHSNRYLRDLNWGEYLHFTSGVAGADLSGLASRAFGWRHEWHDELDRARAEFSEIRY